MNFLSAEKISKSFGERMLFEDLTLGINKGQRIALIGINGCGKSTLMKVLAGLEPTDSGEVRSRKKINVQYLAQEPELEEELTIYQNLFLSDTPELSAIRTYDSLLNSPGADPDALQKAIGRMDQLKAWDYEARIKQVLDKLGISETDRKVELLSGGQKKRVALARALVQEPDLLILDEPTNHLDIGAIEWLEKFLAAQTQALLMVTHDRYFLDRTTTEIWEIDQGELFTYDGNYDYYLEKKAEREEIAATEQDKARKLLKKELEWSRRQPKARTTKSKARLDNVDKIKEKARFRGKNDEMQLNIKQEWGGKTILEMHRVSKAFGDLKILEPFDYAFMRKEKVGIVGKNGVGKTTFLEILTGNEPIDSGKLKPGDNTSFGYYRQSGLEIKPGQKVIDSVREIADVIELEKGQKMTASQMLTLFLFPYSKQHDYVENLSGGERKRLALLKILIQNPTFLILDEPTNDLDILTLEVLEGFLQRFPGVVMIVSHDRYFMDQVVDHLFVFEGEGIIRDFPGNYSHYREWADEEERRIAEEEKAAKAAAAGSAERNWRDKSQDKKKLSFKEKREYEQLTEDIATLESRKKELGTLLNSGSDDYEQLTAWGEELQQVEADLEEKEDRWLELAELV